MSCVNYTPFATLTDQGLLREVWNKNEVSDLEIELAERLDYYIEYAASLLEDAGRTPEAAPETRYRETA